MSTADAYVRLIEESVDALLDGPEHLADMAAFDQRQRAIWDAIRAEGPEVVEAVRGALRKQEVAQ